jgi:hypothetical protein
MLLGLPSACRLHVILDVDYCSSIFSQIVDEDCGLLDETFECCAGGFAE